MIRSSAIGAMALLAAGDMACGLGQSVAIRSRDVDISSEPSIYNRSRVKCGNNRKLSTGKYKGSKAAKKASRKRK